MAIFILTYEYVDDMPARRPAFKDAHVAQLKESQQRGEALFAGVLPGTPEGAMCVFRADSAAAVEAFAKADSYMTAGLIKEWRVREWNVAIGAERLAGSVGGAA
jgi:uncharacterized protein YciI